jgi:hypothetical protein
MRRPIETLSFFVALGAMTACADRVTDPARTVDAGGVQAAASGAAHESGYGVFVGDGTNYIDCIGEDVHTHVEFPFRWSRTVTPSGNIVFKDPFVAGGTGHLEGLTSGNVWTAAHYVGPEVIIANAGQEAFFVAIVRWVSPTAATFTIHNTLHFVQNANGDVKVDRYESHCVTHGNT